MADQLNQQMEFEPSQQISIKDSMPPPQFRAVEKKIIDCTNIPDKKVWMDLQNVIDDNATGDQIIHLNSLIEAAPVVLAEDFIKQVKRGEITVDKPMDILEEALQEGEIQAEIIEKEDSIPDKIRMEVNVNANTISITEMSEQIRLRQEENPEQRFEVVDQKDGQTQTEEEDQEDIERTQREEEAVIEQYMVESEDEDEEDSDGEEEEVIMSRMQMPPDTHIIQALCNAIDQMGLDVPWQLKKILSPPGTDWRLMDPPGPSSRPIPKLWPVLEGKNKNPNNFPYKKIFC